MITARNIVRLFTTIGIIVVAGSAGMFTHAWLRQIPFERLAVSGATHATTEEIARLAAVDSLSPLWHVEPELVADRIQRHPWVKQASVTRLPTGTLRVTVTERRPVLLTISQSGSPGSYIDDEGYPMPLVDGAAYNVPLLRGLAEPSQSLRPLADETVRSLASELALLNENERALLSEFELREREVWMRTAATEDGGSVTVRLGKQGFGEKLARMHAFWHQAILAQPDRRFQLIDLRFDGQIVTREVELRNHKNLN